MGSQKRQAFSRHSFLGLFFSEQVGSFSEENPMKPLLERREGRRLERLSLRPSRLGLYENRISSCGGGPPIVCTFSTQFAHRALKRTLSYVLLRYSPAFA